MANNAARGDIKSQKLVLELRQKRTKRKKIEQLLDKLLKDSYLTEKDINGFLYDDKVLPSKDLCGGDYCKINQTGIIRRVMAWKAVKDAVLLTDLMMNTMRFLWVIRIHETLASEYHYWKGVDSAFRAVALPALQRKQAYDRLAAQREYPRPSVYLYRKSCIASQISRWGILRACRERFDAVKNISGFKEAEQVWLRPDRQQELLDDARRDMSAREYDKFVRMFSLWNGQYQQSAALPSLEECQRQIETAGRLTSISAILDWYMSGKHFDETTAALLL